MTNKHKRQAITQQRKAIDHEQRGLFNLAANFYRIAKSRWQQTPSHKENVNWCDGRISHCQAMTTDDDDDNC